MPFEPVAPSIAEPAAPQIDWNKRVAVKMPPRETATPLRTADWQTRFVNDLGAAPRQANPNAALRIHLPTQPQVAPRLSSL